MLKCEIPANLHPVEQTQFARKETALALANVCPSISGTPTKTAGLNVSIIPTAPLIGRVYGANVWTRVRALAAPTHNVKLLITPRRVLV